jgi:thiol-disulfide isomerase/thioredoxin
MKLQIFFATHCPNCPAAKKVVEKVMSEKGKEFGLEVEQLNVDDENAMLTALQYNIISTPSIVIEGDVVFRGEVPTEAKLLEELQKRK